MLVSTPLDFLGQTESLLLRAPEEEDVGEIADLWTDPRATEHIGGPRDRGMILDGFRECSADPYACARQESERWCSIVERSLGHLVGLCALLEEQIDSQIETELGYAVWNCAPVSVLVCVGCGDHQGRSAWPKYQVDLARSNSGFHPFSQPEQSTEHGSPILRKEVSMR
jgi:hypothetical protein